MSWLSFLLSRLSSEEISTIGGDSESQLCQLDAGKFSNHDP